ncbi:glycerol kinase GlpK [Erythrobacter arachoides]|uniref:ATP:glycerol 3-phosphotransferase n=1 Tax=Aurantiacibacter arachoides TaxID=1850444 RepID=A0A844ZVJ0_9SPHN|nr:glycerol kinase GlpK [Aurantiacibacter arachoides]MXO92321.1 glycerol kinase GlpK [Aurantiacibacter arachoides]GGD58089.1 glycerol kinase [Aurantiacibacter arachoides]
MSQPLILVLDEGTTSTRAMLFDAAGALHGIAQEELAQHYPQSGRVEHDAGEIWQQTLACARAMVTAAGGADRIAAIGITNQRETVVAWDTASGEPLHRAIVWQDRRTANFCAELKAAGHEEAVRAKTGLVLDPYFSATKMRWLLDNSDAVRAAATAGTLAFGTVESWLVWKLTGGARHVTDASNASRTLLLALEGKDWDADLLALFGVPRAALPAIVDCAGDLGTTTLLGASIPICGMAGDQQAATIGQGCLAPGETKATYGTGAFVLANTGTKPPRSDHRLLGTVLWQIAGERTYALEGSVFVAGSLIKYLRDTLGLLDDAAQSEALARSVADSGGVVIVPALAGLGAPHWRPQARGMIAGLGFDSTRAHIARAALEAMAHQTHDLALAFAADDAGWASLRIDGGMAANDWMAQDVADILGIAVVRPVLVETTALGAAMLAAVGAGIHATLAEAATAMIGATTCFTPAMDEPVRTERLARWQAALATV